MATQITVTVTIKEHEKEKLPFIVKNLVKFAGDCEIDQRIEQDEVSLVFETELYEHETSHSLADNIERYVKSIHGGEQVVVSVSIVF